jgi:hypothetical protein
MAATPVPPAPLRISDPIRDAEGHDDLWHEA